MAALSRRKLGYLLKNFNNSFVNQASNFYKARQALFHCSSLLFGKGQEIKMPSLSPTMEQGKIVKWLKKEGDTINPGDVLCDIETDKAVVSMEIEEEGILAKIIAPENTSNIKVGSLIALMVAQGEDWKDLEIPSSTKMQSSSSSDSSGDSGESDQRTAKKEPPTTPIIMPSLSPTMIEGTIVKWLKKEGDTIAPGDVLCDIQTDKAIMSLEAEEEGILAKIIVPDDSKNVKVGTLIALVVPEGEDWKSVVTSETSEAKKERSQSQFPMSGAGGEVRGKKFGPAVKSLLAIYQLESGLIKPSGKGNMLLKEDVLNFIRDNKLERKPPKTVSPSSASGKPTETKPECVLKKKPKDSTSPASKYVDVELTDVRQTAAKKLMESKRGIPHFYATSKCSIDNLLKTKDALQADGIKVSVNDLLTKALALALQMYPKANALFVNKEIILTQNVDVGVAVATDKGLYTPVIKSANQKSLVQISNEIKDLVSKAKSGRIKPEECTGGTFTISNLGMYGITQFKAIINPPQCGILAVGGAIESFDEEMKIKKHLFLNLSFDSRILQEHEGCEFLEIMKYFVNNPKLILLSVNEASSVRL